MCPATAEAWSVPGFPSKPRSRPLVLTTYLHSAHFHARGEVGLLGPPKTRGTGKNRRFCTWQMTARGELQGRKNRGGVRHPRYPAGVARWSLRTLIIIYKIQLYGSSSFVLHCCFQLSLLAIPGLCLRISSFLDSRRSRMRSLIIHVTAPTGDTHTDTHLPTWSSPWAIVSLWWQMRGTVVLSYKALGLLRPSGQQSHTVAAPHWRSLPPKVRTYWLHTSGWTVKRRLGNFEQY